LIQALQREEDRSDISFTVAEAKEQAQLLVDWRVAQVKREGNPVANELALLARRRSLTEVLVGDARACVKHLLEIDCNYIA
jgi:hypothetical protein